MPQELLDQQAHDLECTDTPASRERREALHKLAVISTWVTPSTLMLLRSQRASAASDEEDPPAPPAG